MDGMGLGLLGVRAAKLEAESSRPWAPVVEQHEVRRHPGGDDVAGTRRVRAARTRRVLAGALHQIADAVAPSTDYPGHPAR